MAKDYEKRVEDAFIALFGDVIDLSTFDKRRWRDSSKERVFPVVLVHCSGVDDAPETPTGELSGASVEIAVETYSHDDEDRAILYAASAAVRESVRISSITSDLNAKDGEDLFIAVVNGKSEYISDEDNVNQWRLTLECWLNT